eukprot:9494797-Karenia_brevis.AAC.1
MQGGEVPRGAVVPDKIFPLPLEPVEQCGDSLSRGVRQRISKRARCQGDINRCLASLNWMGGGDTQRSSLPNRVHADVAQLVKSRVGSRPMPTPA